MKPPPTRTAAEIASWLIEQALATPSVERTLLEVRDRLREGGVPVDRLHAAYTTLHPLHTGEAITWSVDKGLEIDSFEHGRSPDVNNFNRSPVLYAIRNEITTLRARLDDPDSPYDFPAFAELRARGYADYLLNATPFDAFYYAGDELIARSGMVASFATRRPEGFSEEDAATISWLRRPLALATKVAVQHGIADELARCYIGRAAGPRVLRGAIRRGDFDSTRAVVWFSDLRDSTELASALPRADYVALLNRFFDCTAGAVQAEGGEPLTYIGDGVLAIFPLDEMGEAEARRASIRASERAIASLGDYNRERAEAGAPALRLGVALHAGDMEYGNIGVPARQSWSVIGPVVNEAARLEGLTKALREPVLASADFARPLQPAWRALGAHALKGVARPFEVFAPPRAD